jgi:hypothetical protein
MKRTVRFGKKKKKEHLLSFCPQGSELCMNPVEFEGCRRCTYMEDEGNGLPEIPYDQ